MDGIQKAKKRAKTFFKYKNLSVPVNIEELIKQYADVEETDIPQKGDALCINNMSKKSKIIIKRNISQYRKRFTLAHELGHLQIPNHTGMLSCDTFGHNDVDSNKYNIMEQEANAFASELLMPTEWLHSVISENENIADALNVIVTKAQVSFMAAVYNLIQIMSDAYLFFLQNNIDDYSHFKYSGNFPKPLLLYGSGELDLEWIYYNTESCEKIEHDTMLVYCFKFKKIYNDETVYKIVDLLLSEANVHNTLNRIINLKDVSLAHLLPSIISKLPSGYILKISYSNNTSFKYLYSHGTFISGKRDPDNDYWYNNYCINHAYSEENGIILNLWKFKADYKLDSSTDKRLSKDILRNIIESYDLDKKSKASIYGHINGIIGALKNNVEKYSKNEFYNILKQKFVGDEGIEFITEHQDFHVFLIKKVIEIYGN